LKAIDNNGYETELDYSPYLNEDDLDTKWPIKFKLAEKLESLGVVLPEQVSSEAMKNKKCDDKDHWDKGWKMVNKKWDLDKKMKQESKMESKKNACKKSITKKYSKTINKIK
jgi:hypothetical protein